MRDRTRDEENIIHILFEKYEGSKRTEPTNDGVKLTEQIIGFTLPRDYIEFITNYHEFENFIGEQFVRLWSLEELIQTNIDYGITDELNNTLGIGTNGSSEFIAIEKVSKERIRIILSPLIDLDEEYHIEIGSSFTNFLLGLDQRENWFK